jgi:hypothetical protein
MCIPEMQDRTLNTSYFPGISELVSDFRCGSRSIVVTRAVMRAPETGTLTLTASLSLSYCRQQRNYYDVKRATFGPDYLLFRKQARNWI